MQCYDAAFQGKKIAATKQGILGAVDQLWIGEILDIHHEHYHHTLLMTKNHELNVLWL